MAKPNFTLPNKPAIKSGSILSYNYTDDFTFVPAPLTFNRDSAATRVNEKGLIEDVGYFGPELVQNGDFSEIGPELIINGDFATNSNWSESGSVEISNGSANFDIVDGVFTRISQTISLTNGKTYKLTLQVLGDNSAKQIYVRDTATGDSGNLQEFITLAEGTTDYTFYFTANADSNAIYIKRQSSGDYKFSIDSVSVKEVGQNWETEGSSSLGLADFQGRSNVANINILNTSTSSRVRQPFNYVNGKRYKVSVDVYLVSGNFRMDCSDSFVSGDFISTSTTGSWITLETEIQAISTGSNYIWLRSSNTISQFYVSNVSVIEVLGDKPRIDYSDSLTEPSLLLEPQSTNLVTYSEDLTGGSLRSAIAAANTIETHDPSGKNNATKFEVTQSEDDSYVRTAYTAAVTDFSCFIYLKGKKGQKFQFFAARDNYAELNPGVLGVCTGEWQKVSFSGTFSTTSSTVIIGLEFGQSIDDSVKGQVYYAWGCQLEALSYPTSYIPTAGSTATRLGETANNAGDVNVFNSEEGVLYAEIKTLSDDVLSSQRSIQLEGLNGSSDNEIIIQYLNNTLRFLLYGNSVLQLQRQETVSLSSYIKVALLYKNNAFKIYINGTETYTVSGSYTMPIGLNKINFDRSGVSNFEGKVRNLKVFNKALTDRELEILTIQ